MFRRPSTAGEAWSFVDPVLSSPALGILVPEPQCVSSPEELAEVVEEWVLVRVAQGLSVLPPQERDGAVASAWGCSRGFSAKLA